MNEVAPGITARVERTVSAMGSPVAEGAAKAVARWISTVAAWNKKIDLTAARSDDELVDLMLADALVIAPRLSASVRAVDIGTGAGAPGLPVALLRGDLSMTLVEPLQKRVALLRTTAFELAKAGGDDPDRVRVVRARGEDLARRGDRFDVAISRATLPPPEWLRLGAELAPSGEVWVLLAQGEPPALDGWIVADDVRYRWPLTGAERRAARFIRSE